MKLFPSTITGQNKYPNHVPSLFRAPRFFSKGKARLFLGGPSLNMWTRGLLQGQDQHTGNTVAPVLLFAKALARLFPYLRDKFY